MSEKDEVQNKLRALQHQVRMNANDTVEYLSELQRWEKDIRKKDMDLSSEKSSSKNGNFPVRGSSGIEKPSGKCSGQCAKARAKKAAGDLKSQRIKSSDYKAWDNFDVDRVCADMDYEIAPGSEDDERCGSECDCEDQQKSPEDIEKAARQKRAEFEKSLGNQFFEKGSFMEAEKYYTNAINYDPTNPIYFSNRAMANLKLKRFKNAEEDCDMALKLDPQMIKAYHRRATARLSQKNLTGAKVDFLKLLNLDPKNREAQEKVDIINQWETKQSGLAENTASSCASTIREDSVQVSLITPLSSKVAQSQRQKEGKIPIQPLEKPLISESPVTVKLIVE